MALITLGGLELAGQDFPQRQALLLLTYLKVEGRKERSHLAELFWPEAKKPLNNLSSAMTRLRGVDPSMVRADRYTVEVDVRTDYERFLDHVAAGRAAEALEVYRGRFLDGVALERLGLELEEWVLDQRASLAAVARDCAVDLARRATVEGDGSAAGRWAELALSVGEAAIPDPDVVVDLHHMMTSVNSPLVTRLRAEAIDLGVDPAQVQKRADSPTPPGGRAVEQVDRPFFNREDELEAMVSALDESRIVSLEGLGGVGKTQLARRLLNSVDDRYGPAYWVASDRAGSIDLLPEIVSQVLAPDGDPARTFDDLAGQIGDNPMIVTLDGVDELASEMDAVVGLVERCPRLAIVLTSRSAVKVPQVSRVPLTGLARSTPGDQKAGPALQLFQAWFQRRAPVGATLDLGDPSVREICDRLAGLPLAIELAAGWLSVLTPGEIAEDLRRSTELLADPEVRQGGEHTNFESVMTRTWALLDDESRHAICRLSIFPSGFDRAAAETVGRCSLVVLRRLAGWSLLSRVDDRHYRCHPLVRAFAQQRLADDPAAHDEARTSHARYLLDEVAGAPTVETFEAADVLSVVEDPVGNLVVAWEWLFSRLELEAMAKLIDPLDRVLGRFGRHYTLLDLLETTLDRLRSQQVEAAELMDRLSMHQVWLDLRLGSYERAAETADRLLAGSADGSPLDDEVLVELSRARAAIDRTEGNVDAAIARLTPARAAAERVSPRMLALIEDDLGLCQMILGDYEASRRSYQAVLTWARSVGSQPIIARTLLSLGVGHFDAGEIIDSLSYLMEAKSVVVVDKLTHLEPYVDAKLARAHLAAGEPAAARRLVDSARRSDAAWEPWLGVEFDIVSARLAATEANPNDVWAFLDRALTAAVDLNDVPFIAKVYVAMAELSVADPNVIDELGMPIGLVSAVAADGSGADAADRRAALDLLARSKADDPVKNIIDVTADASDHIRRSRVLARDPEA